MTPQTFTALNAALDEAVADQRLAGAVLLVAEGGEIALRRAVGMARLDAATPMQIDTVFRLASVTKPIIAATALALAEAGLLPLDAPLTTWLPEFEPRLAGGRAPLLTPRHLLCHSAGLSYRFEEELGGPYAQAGVSDGIGEVSLSFEENLARIVSVPLRFAPGSAWAYSVAMDVLGGVLERAAGQSLEELVQRFINEPLGTSFSFTARAAENLAGAYRLGPNGPIPIAEDELVPLPGETRGVIFGPSRALTPGAYPSGGAGLCGTASDVLVFLEALRQGDKALLQDHGPLLSNQLPKGVPSFAAGWGWAMAGSVVLDPELGQTVLPKGALQWGGVYGHSWVMDPASGRTAVLLGNTAYEGMNGKLVDEIRRALFA